MLKNTLFKRQIWAAFIAIFITSCTTATNPPIPTAAPTANADANVLKVHNWDTYIDPQILTDFSKEYNVVVEYSVYDSDSDMLDEVRDGAVYDVVIPTDFTVEIMRTEGLLRPLNHDNIPNLVNLSEQFISPAYDPGNRYCAAYQWGTIGIGYNSDVITDEIEGWADFFDPKYAGRIAMLDESRNGLATALLLLNHSPNTTNQEHIEEAITFLETQKENIASFAPDTGQDMLLAGDVDMVMEWSGDIFQAIEENPAIRYVIPQEGSVIWTDNMCIPANASNPDLAEVFINYILDAEVGAQLSTFVRYASPNRASLSLLSEEDRNNKAIYPPPAVQDRLFLLVNLDPNTVATYDDLWSRLVNTP
jgi:spermidine/putrescine transport system substrate-binding protein